VTIVYRRELLANAILEIRETLPAMWAEMAPGFGAEQPEPRWDLYFTAEKRDAAFLLTAREEGRLVGYFGMILHDNPSLKNELAATATPYYVVPHPRRGMILLALIRHAIRICQRAKVKKAMIKTHPWASAESLLVHLGAREVSKDFMFDLAVREVKEVVNA